jgi:hypothetical protein
VLSFDEAGVEADNGLNQVGNAARERGGTEVAAVFSAGRLEVVEFHVEGFVDGGGGAGHLNGSSRWIGFYNLQTVLDCEFLDLLDFVGVRAVEGRKILVREGRDCAEGFGIPSTRATPFHLCDGAG